MQTVVDINKAEELTCEVGEAVDCMFMSPVFDGMKKTQLEDYALTGRSLAASVKIIIESVPPCVERKRAIEEIMLVHVRLGMAIRGW